MIIGWCYIDFFTKIISNNLFLFVIIAAIFVLRFFVRIRRQD